MLKRTLILALGLCCVNSVNGEWNTSAHSVKKGIVVSNLYTMPSTFKDMIRSNELIRESYSSAVAGSAQVITLMWLRTINSYQSNYDVSFFTALRNLYEDGGLSRFYRGLPVALVQGPLSRMGSIVSNTLAIQINTYNKLYLYNISNNASNINIIPTTVWVLLRPLFELSPAAIGSVLSGLWRVFLMPLDTIKVCVIVHLLYALCHIYSLPLC